MPILDGFQTVEILRNKSNAGEIDIQHTKIFAFSAMSEIQFKEDIQSHLFDGFLEKPLSFDKLQAILTL